MENKNKIFTRQKGQSLFEVLIALTIFIIGASSAGFLVLDAATSFRKGAEKTQAASLAREGLEAARSIRDGDFDNLTPGSHGIALSGNKFIFQGLSDITGQFTRNLTITDIDIDTKKIESQVVWQFLAGRQDSVILTDYLTDWNQTQGQGGDFSANIGSAVIGGTGNTELQGITIQNTGAQSIVVDKITVNWNNANLIREIRIGGIVVWSRTGPGTPTGNQPSGTLLDIQDVTLAPGAAATLINRFRFTGSMTGATFNITFTMLDGSTKHLLVQPGVMPPDIIAPAAITDLALSGATSNSINLNWTAPGDDDFTGTAANYDIRYSTSSITDANWSSTNQAAGAPTPLIAGSAQSMTVSGLLPNTLYYFAIKTSDEAPNVSAISNIPSLATTASATQADSLAINIGSAVIGGTGNTELQGITIQNTGAQSIVVDKITVNWNNANLIREIRIGGIVVWSRTGPGTPTGNQPSGTLLDIQDVTLAPGAAATLINRFRFTGSMTGATFNITFTMLDGSTKTTGNFTR